VQQDGSISEGASLDREIIWISKGNSRTTLDKEDVFFPEYDGYQVAQVIRGEMSLHVK